MFGAVTFGSIYPAGAGVVLVPVVVDFSALTPYLLLAESRQQRIEELHTLILLAESRVARE